MDPEVVRAGEEASTWCQGDRTREIGKRERGIEGNGIQQEVPAGEESEGREVSQGKEKRREKKRRGGRGEGIGRRGSCPNV